jgi:hypothetical protein
VYSFEGVESEVMVGDAKNMGFPAVFVHRFGRSNDIA